MRDIKPMKYGYSVVAISKFLHFWNPRLFVIVDDAIMWKWVFAHRWLRAELRQIREHIQPVIEPDAAPMGSVCDLLSYLAVLVLSAELLRANPAIAERFASHVCRHAPDAADEVPLHAYDAAAVEWLLLGLVELPPAGVATEVPLSV